jgi:hypothetical protein
MVSIFIDTQSFSSTHFLCEQLLISNSDSNSFLTRPVIRLLLMSYFFEHAYYVVGASQLDSINQSSSSLSCDHTYKFVNKLRVANLEKMQVN